MVRIIAVDKLTHEVIASRTVTGGRAPGAVRKIQLDHSHRHLHVTSHHEDMPWNVKVWVDGRSDPR